MDTLRFLQEKITIWGFKVSRPRSPATANVRKSGGIRRRRAGKNRDKRSETRSSTCTQTFPRRRDWAFIHTDLGGGGDVAEDRQFTERKRVHAKDKQSVDDPLTSKMVGRKLRGGKTTAEKLKSSKT